MSQNSGPELVACRLCGIVMVRLGRDVCPKCFVIEEGVFQKVKQYLQVNEGASIDEVAEAVDCTAKQVKYFIRSGRLERIGAKIAHPCQICQEIILEGIICASCKKTLKEQVNSLKDKISEKKSDENSDKNSKDLIDQSSRE